MIEAHRDHSNVCRVPFVVRIALTVLLSGLIAHFANADEPQSLKYSDAVLNDHPVAYWRFEDSKFETHPKSIGHGKIAAGVPLRLYDEDDLNDVSAESKGFVRVGQAG